MNELSHKAHPKATDIETPRGALVVIVVTAAVMGPAQSPRAAGGAYGREIRKALESALPAELLQFAKFTAPTNEGETAYEHQPAPALRPIPTRADFEARTRRVHSALTEREREVLCLVAGGATNRSIASWLSISPKTASVHVSRILTKLGATTRTEAAALAHASGLVRCPDVANPRAGRA